MQLPNRIIADNVLLYDQCDTLMLQANRIAAKIQLSPLFKHKIHINNTQFIGAKVHIYKQTAKENHNFQFIVNKFASNDTTSQKDLNLRIGSIHMRQCALKYEILDKPIDKNKISFNHIDLQNVNLTAQIKSLQKDSLNICINKFNVRERSGFEIQKLKLELIAGKDSATFKDFILELPHTLVEIPLIKFNYEAFPKGNNVKDWFSKTEYQGKLNVSATPSDIKSFIPQLKHFSDGITLEAKFEGKGENISVSQIKAFDQLETIVMQASANMKHIFSNLQADITLHHLKANNNTQKFITKNINGQGRELSSILTRMGNIEIDGNGFYSQETSTANLCIKSAPGTINFSGKITDNNVFESNINTDKFSIRNILDNNQKQDFENISLTAKIKGKIKGERNKPELLADGIINQITYKNYTYRGIDFIASNKGDKYNLDIALNDINGNLKANISSNLNEMEKMAIGEIEISHLNPYQLNLTPKFQNERFNSQLRFDLKGRNIDNLAGNITIDNFLLQSEKSTIATGPILLNSHPEENEKKFNIESDFLNLKVEGEFKWKNLIRTFNQIANHYLPSIFEKKEKEKEQEPDYRDDIHFTAQIKDTAIIERLIGIPIRIPQTANIDGNLDGSLGIITLNAKAPSLNYGNEQLQQIDLHIQNTKEEIQANIILERIMKGTPIEMGVKANTKEDCVHLLLHWNNKKEERAQVGEIDLTSKFFKDFSGNHGVSGKFNESNLIINDSIWTIHPSMITLHDGVIDIDEMKISKAERYLNVQGRVSKNETDSIIADLHQINLAYIFDIINFHSIEFEGQATGRVYASGLMGKPNMDAFLHVKDFTFNEGYMGEMHIHGNWGQHEKSIYLDANIQDPSANHHTTVRGTITPGRKPGSGLDLNIRTKRCNLYFLNKYTDAIFTNFQGRASGWAHIYGPFKGINIEGDLVADEASMGVNALGVRYHLSGDSIILRPNNIMIRNATVYDPYGGPGQEEHYAIVNGQLMHTNLKNLKFNFDIEAQNLLGYDFKSFGEESFYGTIYATGQVNLKGEPGLLTVDMNGKAERGSIMVYNATSPETITEAGFITYISKSTTSNKESTNKETLTNNKTDDDEEEDSETDIYLNFNINVTPDLTLRLLMDAQTGDYINLYGNSHILANYYNKGKFRMYGTYRVDHGVYKLSLQDVIHKDFQFQQDGTITFGGDAYQAALNLKASYMVPNVSLDDLSTTGLGFSNTRVDCIMNITGRPSAPVITFDFDLPNANEDERQMIRTLLSTEEERNMQVIYLLGIGKFYNYGTQYMANSNQSTAAVNSLISSTLSSQFNQIMSNAMGTDKWSFGANLRTGETGWDQLDVEGILSGRLLNNRLLINGNIGYRESYYSTNNFIGDFDVQYILTPSGNLSLKAYNQTNDRYFIQSSLTTQGIGLQFKKDFNHWKELFKINRTKKRDKKK